MTTLSLCEYQQRLSEEECRSGHTTAGWSKSDCPFHESL